MFIAFSYFLANILSIDNYRVASVWPNSQNQFWCQWFVLSFEVLEFNSYASGWFSLLMIFLKMPELSLLHFEDSVCSSLFFSVSSVTHVP